MFDQSDSNANYLHHYFANLIKKFFPTENNNNLDSLLESLESIFFHSKSAQQLRNNFILMLSKFGVTDENLFKKLALFVSVMDGQTSFDKSLLKDKEDIRALIMWSIYFNQQTCFDSLVKIANDNNNVLDPDIIAAILKHGSLEMFCNYVSDEMINQIQIDKLQKNKVKDLALLKFLIQRRIINREDLDYLSLSTATDNQNILLLTYLLDDIKVQNQSKSNWIPSAFFTALKKYNKEILLKLVESGAFNLTEEFSSVLSSLNKDITDPSDDSDDEQDNKNIFIGYSLEEIDKMIKVFAKEEKYRNELITVINDMKKNPLVPDMQNHLQSFLTKIEEIEKKIQQPQSSDKFNVKIQHQDTIKFISDSLHEKEDEKTIKQLAKLLDYLQPALSSACHFINKNNISIEEYIEIFKSKSYIMQAEFLKSFQSWREQLPIEKNSKDELTLLSTFMEKQAKI